MRRRREPPTLTLEDLPTEVRAAVEAMMLGDEVELFRGTRSVGVLSFRSTVLEGVVVHSPRIRGAREQAIPDGVTVVATVVPLSPAARQRLSDELGEEYVVLDVNEAPDTADVVLTHAVSPQLLGLLRSRFTRARVLVTEIEDDELGIHQSGPVSRLLDAGASAYLPPRPIGEVADNVRTFLEASQAPELTGSPRRAPALPSPREP